MNAEEAKLIEGKLQGILNGIKEFGDQTEQFAKVGNKLEEAVEANKHMADALSGLTQECKNLIDEVKAKVYDGVFSDIKDQADRLASTAGAMTDVFNVATSKMMETATSIEQRIGDFIEKEEKDNEESKASLSYLKSQTEEIKGLSQGLGATLEEMKSCFGLILERLSAQETLLREQGNTTLQRIDSAAQENKDGNELLKAKLDSVAKENKGETESLRTKIDDLSLALQKSARINRILLVVGIVLSAIAIGAAIASIFVK